jgi:signal peptidase I
VISHQLVFNVFVCLQLTVPLSVASGSMEPAFYRGDLLFLTNYNEEPIRVGEIVVFKIEGREIPIVHRVLRVHEKLVSDNFQFCTSVLSFENLPTT